MLEQHYWNNWMIRTGTSWNDVKSIIKPTGVEAIDFGNQVFLDYAIGINPVIDLMLGNKVDYEFLKRQKVVFSSLIRLLCEYHKKEEEIIKRYDLPNLEKQVAEHREIEDFLKKKINEFNGGRIQVLHDFKTSFIGHLIEHINSTDYETFKRNKWKNAIVKAGTAFDVIYFINLTGHKDFDQDHKAFLDSLFEINDLIKEMTENPNTIAFPVKVKALLDNLAEQATEHLDREVAFTRENNIEDDKELENYHKNFLQSLNSFRTIPEGDKRAFLEKMKYDITVRWLYHVNELNKNSISFEQLTNDLVENDSVRERCLKAYFEDGEDLQFISELLSTIEEIPLPKDEGESSVFQRLSEKASSFIQCHKKNVGRKNRSLSFFLNKYEEDLLESADHYKNFIEEKRIFITSHTKTDLMSKVLNYRNAYQIAYYYLSLNSNTVKEQINS